MLAGAVRSTGPTGASLAAAMICLLVSLSLAVEGCGREPGQDTTARSGPSTPRSEGPVLVPWPSATACLDSLAFSPDGKLIASGGHAMTVNVWDAATGTCVTTLAAHTGFISSVAFSPAGGPLASGSCDGTVRLWDVGTRREVSTLTAHTRPVLSVAFSPDGKLLAAATAQGPVEVWDVRGARQVQSLAPRKGWASKVAFAPDGRELAVVASKGSVELWDVNGGREVRVLDEHVLNWPYSAVSFSPDAKYVAWITRFGVKLASPAGGWKVYGLGEHITPEGGSLAFSPDGRLLAWGTYAARIQVWSTGSRRQLWALRGHTGSVTSVAFSPDGKRLASASLDGTLRLWDLARGQLVATFIALDGGKEWATVVPEGYCNSSAGARRRLAWGVANAMQPYGRYERLLHRPDMVQKALAGEKIEPPAHGAR